MGSIFAILAKIMAVLPAAVQTIEVIANHKDSMTKKEMAHAAVISAAGIADVFTNPEQKQLADAVTAVVHNGIDLTVQAANVVGEFTHKGTPVTVPAVAAAQAEEAKGTLDGRIEAQTIYASVDKSADAVKVGPGLHSVVPA